MKHVLVVDDKTENLYLLRMLLRGHGFEVDEASHGAEALVKARARPPQLIVSDLLMPVMDGYSLLRYWKADARLGGIPFVVYTATYTDPSDELLALDLGADAFILKPAQPEAFMARISEVLALHDRRALQPVRVPIADEQVTLKEYSEVLVHKLEDKLLQLDNANQRLSRSEAHLRAVFDAEPECVKLLAPDGSVLDINQAGLLMIEAGSLAEIQGRCMYPLVAEAQRAAVAALVPRLLRGETGVIEFELIGLRGTHRWLEMRGSPLRDTEGRATTLVCVTRDITMRRQAERERDALLLRERDARLQIEAILDSISDGFMALDRDWRITHINSQGAVMVGRQAADLLGKNVWNEFPATVGHAFQRAFERALGEQVAVRIEDHYAPLDLWLEVRIHPRPEGLAVFFHDVSARRQTDEALRVSEARYRRLVDSNVVGVIIANVDGRISEANDQFLAMLGRSRAELDTGSLRWDSITPPEWNAIDQQVRDELQRFGTCPAFEKEYLHAHGHRVPIRAVVAMLNAASGECICLISDLTQARQVEARVQAQLDELKRWHEVTLGREDRIIELKREINALCARTGEPPRYASQAERPGAA